MLCDRGDNVDEAENTGAGSEGDMNARAMWLQAVSQWAFHLKLSIVLGLLMDLS